MLNIGYDLGGRIHGRIVRSLAGSVLQIEIYGIYVKI